MNMREDMICANIFVYDAYVCISKGVINTYLKE